MHILSGNNLRPLSRTRRLPPPASAAGASRQQKITHSISPEKIDIFKSLEPWASENLLPFLRPVEKCWQPYNFLPNPARPDNDFLDEVRALRDQSEGLPDEYFVVLVGDMITEEALPTYQSLINMNEGIRDGTGSSPSPWATWNRAWSAEENRHGDLLRTYLYLSGRVDMLMVEKTVQYLIGAGMDVGLHNHPYLTFVYTSFQERATFISHSNTAGLAKEGGDPTLAKICGIIAGDEKRHEGAYVSVVEKLLEVDPNEAMVAIGKMMRMNVTMPAHLMYDGRDPKLFQHFAYVAHRMGVYTPDDYADILEFLVGRWRLEKIQGLNGDGKCEQDFVCNLATRIRKLQARADGRIKKEGFKNLKFSWIFNKNISL